MPIAAEIDRRPSAADQHEDGADLQAVAVTAVIFLPGSLPRVTNQVDAGDVDLVRNPGMHRILAIRLS